MIFKTIRYSEHSLSPSHWLASYLMIWKFFVIWSKHEINNINFNASTMCLFFGVRTRWLQLEFKDSRFGASKWHFHTQNYHHLCLTGDDSRRFHRHKHTFQRQNGIQTMHKAVSKLNWCEGGQMWITLAWVICAVWFIAHQFICPQNVVFIQALANNHHRLFDFELMCFLLCAACVFTQAQSIDD